MKVIFLTGLLLLAISQSTNGKSVPGNKKACPPGPVPVDCPFPDHELSTFFPHANDCHWFFHCSNGVPYCKVCSANLYWNQALETCDWPENVDCGGGGGTGSTTTSNPETPSSTQVSGSPSHPTESPPAPCPAGTVPKCPFPDPAYSVFFPHENDPHWFYHCSNGVAYCKVCPADLVWNQDKETCDYPENGGGSESSSPSGSTTPGSGSQPTTAGPAPSCPSGAVPECPVPDPAYSVFFPHENDPHWFYHCSNGVAYCKVCPADLVWNQDKETCDYPENGGGSESSSPSGTTTPGSGSQPTTAGPSPSCPSGAVPECPVPDPAYSVFFPHENDPHWFYHCSNGVAYCKLCPADLVWNQDKETCDWPENGGGSESSSPSGTTTPGSGSQPTTAAPSPSCPSGAVPECPNPDPALSVFFPHENDCHWFYHCSNGVAYCKVCPADLHWNPDKDTCDYSYRAGCNP